MKAYRTHIVIKDPHNVTVPNVPFRPGQHVEVLFLAQDEIDADLTKLQALFKDTHSLPQIQTLTEEEIAAEVAAYRRGQ